MKFLEKPFGYERVLTKEDLQQVTKKKKGPRANDWKSVLARIWKIVDEQRFLLVMVLVMVVMSSALALIGPFLIGKIIDEYIVPGQFEGMLWMVGILIIIYIVLSISLYLQNYWMIGIAQQTIYRMRVGVFNKLLRLPISFFDKRQHGELMSRATNDIETVSSTLNSAFIQVFSSVLTLTGTLLVMLYLSPLLTLLTMSIIPAMFIAMRWITRRTGKLFKEQQAAVGALNGMIEETISGQRIVKAFSQEERVKAEFQEKSARLRLVGFWALAYSGYIPKVMNTLNNASFAIVAGVGGLLAINNHVSIGVIVIFTEYARQFTRPLNDLANQFNTVLSAIAGAERVFAIMDEADEVETGHIGKEQQLKGAVAFQHVSFKYEQAEEAHTLRDVSFVVKPGQTAALVGATGAGKTTIMQLISRFYDTNEGAVLFDGVDVRDFTREALRSQMAFVLQEPFLFEATVYENIRYGRLDATNEEIEEAAKKANAHDFIMKLPQGYNTLLTADGSEISQGQKQLLSIARAFVADPVILLLDEATSSIDTVTEMKIQEALEVLMEGRTSFVIAHRLNTIRNADVVFVMQKGELVEAGSQQELIAKNGIYASMVN
ncbi:ABC transporter ATP-binding protein [Metasolibacillus sp.]|uniref:ABC transporter ATP-binding protein n=1 Tax=Metasolibacillus sp. TaxID=2703680 RepID=UPI0025F4C3E3|nr:ABC transporter ATP-binding protein [Metasolibacillus sp.]MCT6925233.1 ABC transporter ATP-binding protein/permease [Metasolibacillus sp.]MCT6941409.1 ABC transporter ATP-binding protein/permease [Metasolibacillus sp.]